MNKMSVTEKRWRDGSGERYMSDGVTIRCQATAKGKLGTLRLENPDLSAAESWPETQCTKSAIEGTFICRYHGGLAPQVEKKSILDFMPVDFREIVDTFRQNPELLDSYLEMAQLVARNAQIYEGMNDNMGGPSSWLEVKNAVKYIEETGNLEQGLERIKSALGDVKNTQEAWDELRTNMEMLKNLRTTQFRIEKDLKTTATIEQVRGLVEKFHTAILRAAESVIEDERLRERFIATVSAEIRGASNIRVVGPSISVGDNQ